MSINRRSSMKPTVMSMSMRWEVREVVMGAWIKRFLVGWKRWAFGVWEEESMRIVI